jgi:hypothetical protein
VLGRRKNCTRIISISENHSPTSAEHQTYRRSNTKIHHRDPVRHIPSHTPQRETRSFIRDRLPASNQQDENGSCVRAVEEDRAAGDVGVESDRGPKVEQAEEDVEDGDGEDGVDGDVEVRV